MKQLYFLLSICILTSSFSFAQKVKPFKEYNPENKITVNFKAKIDAFPDEVWFGVKLDRPTRKIYFLITDINYFDVLFPKKKSGIVIDLIKKSQFSCSRANNDYSSNGDNFYGKSMFTTLRNELESNKEKTTEGYYRFEIGRLPNTYKFEDVEINFQLFIKNQLTYYRSSYSLESNYLDTFYIPFLQFPSVSENFINYTKTLEKELEAEVKFQRNQTKFNQTLLDSLHHELQLTDYTIQSIIIEAYSSIEGNPDKNKKIQQKRAQALIEELRPYMHQNAEVKIETKENWDAFFEDISSTSYAYLGTKSKKEIQQSLMSQKVLKGLEPIFQKHRKGMIKVALKKKENFYMLSNEESIEVFNTMINKKEYEKAYMLQNIIFSKIQVGEFTKDTYEKVKVPNEPQYGYFLNNEIFFLRNSQTIDIPTAIKKFKALLELIPDTEETYFNIANLKVQYYFDNYDVSDKDILSLLRRLVKNNFDPVLMDKLLFNYHLGKIKKAYSRKDYKQVRASINEIDKLFKEVDLSDDEILRLAKYYSLYSQYKKRDQLLATRINENNVSEDLLFYYLNITIIDPKYLTKSTYKQLLFKAIDLNRKRFCQMFNSNLSGGITFQLLHHDILKEIYCKECSIMN